MWSVLKSAFLAPENDLNFEHFTNLKNEVLKDEHGNLGNRIIEWLITGESRLANKFLWIDEQDEDSRLQIKLDLSKKEWPKRMYPFLGRKIVGWFFYNPRFASSLLLELIKACPSETLSETSELLFDPLLINFQSSLKEHLEAQQENEIDHVVKVINYCLDKLDQYQKEIRSVGSLPELCPSERDRQNQLQKQQQESSAAVEAAKRKSTLLSMIPQSVLLYGAGAVSYISSPTEEPHRVETPLGAFSHSVELPRIEIIDPVGIQLQLFSFRTEAPPS